MQNLKELLFKHLYTSLLFQLAFLGVIGLSVDGIVSSYQSAGELILNHKVLSEIWYTIIAIAYFVGVYLPSASYPTKKLVARLCIYALTISFFIYQQFIVK